ncbi:MAG: hypothetical protein IT184_00605 [Acidobacteria bacterium]|nr:hypothetical protein [Acidobacteriota bacterium]
MIVRHPGALPAAGTPAHRHRDEGATLADVVVALGLVLTLGVLSVPVTARAVEAGRVRHAAGFIAAIMRDARQQAAFEARSVGVAFEPTHNGWTLRRCADGNGNGLRRADIADGIDECSSSPTMIERVFKDVAIAVDPALRGPAGEPGSPDPVRFGASNLASFSPDGDATAGTAFIRSASGIQYCVRVGGVNGRTRVLRYDPGSRTWQP